ncbi:MAG: hypothetical protein JXA98_01670, partial [Methanosarcinaceae archaeon]|nr:hypothetical protein [Methanosarcinaceae archaeon]
SIEGEEKISVIDMVGAIQHIQNVIYHIGDYLYGNPNRPKGDFPQIIKDSCTLFITNLEMGSVHAEMQIGNGQISLPDSGGTLGERSICVTNELFEALSYTDVSEEELYDIINDPHRVNKLLKEFYLLWPDVQSKKEIIFAFGKSPQTKLNPKQKDVIQTLLHKSLNEYEKEVFGRVIEIRVDQKRKIQIDTPEGSIECHYTSDIEDTVRDVIGELVTIRGVMTPTSKGNFILSIDNEASVESMSQYRLKTMKEDGIEKKLLEEILLDVDFEDDYYIVSNDELGLLAVQQKMKQAIEEIQGQLSVLWQEYVAVDEDDLATSGKDLKNKLISIVGAHNG